MMSSTTRPHSTGNRTPLCEHPLANFLLHSGCDSPATQFRANPLTDHVFKPILLGSLCYVVEWGAIKSAPNN